MAKILTKILAPILIAPSLILPQYSEAGGRGTRNSYQRNFNKAADDFGKSMGKSFEKGFYGSILRQDSKSFSNDFLIPYQKGKPLPSQDYLRELVSKSEISEELINAIKSEKKFERNSIYNYYRIAFRGSNNPEESILKKIFSGPEKYLADNSYLKNNSILNYQTLSENERNSYRQRFNRIIPWDFNWETPDLAERLVLRELSSRFYAGYGIPPAPAPGKEKNYNLDLIKALNAPRIQDNKEKNLK